MSTQRQDGTQEIMLAPGPLFVVSMWRSGSSLLYALLNKHPRVALMYEADLMLLRPVFLKPHALCDWAERWEFWNEGFQRHGLTAGEAGDGISDFPSAFKAAHQLYAKRRGATIWGDKSPNYYDRLNEMADDFPEARFIIVWRDPKSTANSILRAASLGNSYFSRKGATHCGLLGYEVLKKECDRLLARGKQVCQVNYEDMIQDTPSVMRHVCNFLRIPYDDSLSTPEGADRSAMLEGQHHANLKGNKIVRGPRPELVGVALREKIWRYLVWWQWLHGPSWPPYPLSADNAAQMPSGFSRLIDRALYRIWRIRDRMSPFAFCFVPMSLLNRYREGKKRRQEAGHIAHSSPVDARVVPYAAALNGRAAHGEGLS
jgi:hypothetical protein